MSIRITRVPDNALFANYAIRFHRLCGLGIWPADGARKTLAACLKMGSLEFRLRARRNGPANPGFSLFFLSARHVISFFTMLSIGNA